MLSSSFSYFYRCGFEATSIVIQNVCKLYSLLCLCTVCTCACVQARVCHSTCVLVRGQLHGVDFLFLPLRGSQGLSSSPQVCAANLSLAPVVPNVKNDRKCFGKDISSVLIKCKARCKEPELAGWAWLPACLW